MTPGTVTSRGGAGWRSPPAEPGGNASLAETGAAARAWCSCPPCCAMASAICALCSEVKPDWSIRSSVPMGTLRNGFCRGAAAEAGVSFCSGGDSIRGDTAGAAASAGAGVGSSGTKEAYTCRSLSDGSDCCTVSPNAALQVGLLKHGVPRNCSTTRFTQFSSRQFCTARDISRPISVPCSRTRSCWTIRSRCAPVGRPCGGRH